MLHGPVLKVLSKVFEGVHAHDRRAWGVPEVEEDEGIGSIAVAAVPRVAA